MHNANELDPLREIGESDEIMKKIVGNIHNSSTFEIICSEERDNTMKNSKIMTSDSLKIIDNEQKYDIYKKIPMFFIL